MTNGEEGELIAPLPIEMYYSRDPFNEGVINEWVAPGKDDSDWEKVNTFFLRNSQVEYENKKGHGYRVIADTVHAFLFQMILRKSLFIFVLEEQKMRLGSGLMINTRAILNHKGEGGYKVKKWMSVTLSSLERKTR